MKTGVDYYPEHWDKSLWEQDADLMKKKRCQSGAYGGVCLE